MTTSDKTRAQTVRTGGGRHCRQACAICGALTRRGRYCRLHDPEQAAREERHLTHVLAYRAKVVKP